MTEYAAMTKQQGKRDKDMSVVSRSREFGDETSALLRNLCKLTTSYIAHNKKQEFLDCYEAPVHYDTRQQIIDRLARGTKKPKGSRSSKPRYGEHSRDKSDSIEGERRKSLIRVKNNKSLAPSRKMKFDQEEHAAQARYVPLTQGDKVKLAQHVKELLIEFSQIKHRRRATEK